MSNEKMAGPLDSNQRLECPTQAGGSVEVVARGSAGHVEP